MTAHSLCVAALYAQIESIIGMDIKCRFSLNMKQQGHETHMAIQAGRPQNSQRRQRALI
jgi:hypothetical protein